MRTQFVLAVSLALALAACGENPTPDEAAVADMADPAEATASPESAPQSAQGVGEGEDEVAEYVPYPASVKTAFLQSCAASGGPEIVCNCTYDEFESYLTIEEYMAFESRMILNQSTEDDTALLTEIRSACMQ